MRIACYFLLCILSVTTVNADEIRASFAMDADPLLQAPPPVKYFHSGYKPLWLQTLARPEADLQRTSAETIAQAHIFGFPGLIEARPRLLEILVAEGTHPTARFAAARCLIVLDTRDAAQPLLDAAKRHGADLRQLVEPALGQWKFQPILEVWRPRLTAADTRYRDLLLAIQGIAQMEDGASVPQLLKIVHDPLRSAPARLESARVAGKLQNTGLEPEVAKLTAGSEPSQVNRLCAVNLLSRHDSEAARAALLKLGVDKEPTIAAPALKRLLAINPDLVVPLAADAMLSPDPIVRLHGSEAYAARPNVERVVSLVRLLDDPHPMVRGSVREALYIHTKTPEFDAVLRPAFTATLAADNWRGQEQAILLLATLDHKAAAPRFIELLQSPRDEVMTTAAWGLKILAIPETLPAALTQAQHQTDTRKGVLARAPAIDAQVVHLVEMMGLMHYAPAEPLLRLHVPKNQDLGQFSRGAAIWALGHLHLDKPDEELAKALAERAADIYSIPPETIHVQVMSTVSLGRMKATSQIPAIRKLMGGSLSPTRPNMAYRWAINRMTGEEFPALEPFRNSKAGWFVTPLDDQPETTKPAAPK